MTSSTTTCGCSEQAVTCDTGKRLLAQMEIDYITWTLTGGQVEFEAYDDSREALAFHLGLEAADGN